MAAGTPPLHAKYGLERAFVGECTYDQKIASASAMMALPISRPAKPR